MDQIANRLRVLIVDDDEAVRARLAGILERTGYLTIEAETAEAAVATLANEPIDAILMDIQLPGRSGLDALNEISVSHPGLPIIMVTGHASLDGAVEAIRNQAFDYLIKPVSPTDLKFALKRATRLQRLERENRSLRDLVETAGAIDGVVAKSQAMMDVVSLVRQLSSNDSPVLIRGESGTGKDVVARAMHLEGTRSAGSFVAINCAALPETLLESELFGYVRGAFSGADTAKHGLFAKADGGTLFLDEIGEMPAALQSKLLRVLQDGRVRPLGATSDFACDVRIIAATNRNIIQAIEDGDFRSDLFYRLNVIPIEIEPLRQRIEDIAPLAYLFVSRIDPERHLDASAIAALECHDWPGNVRELGNVIERSLALSNSAALSKSDLRIGNTVVPKRPVRSQGQTEEWKSIQQSAKNAMSLKEVEAAYVDAVLERVSGNKTEAAKILGINRTTLYRRTP